MADESRFGHDIFAMNPGHVQRQLQLGRDLGLGWMRTVVTWGQIEKEKGIYDWRLLDRIIEEAGRNKQILLTLYSSNGHYCRHQEIKKKLPVPFNDPNRTPSSRPENMEDYKRFLQAVVSRYKHKIKYWQIENEVYSVRFLRKIPDMGGNEPFPVGEYWLGPIDEYIELLKAAYTTIREVDSRAVVLLSGIYMEPWVPDEPMPVHRHFFKEIIARVDKTLKDAGDCFDVLDFHHYFSPESLRPRIAFLKNIMEKYGYKKEIWITESGGISLELHPEFKNSLHTDDEQKQQAKELVKFYVTAFALGVKKVFWFELSPPPQTLKILKKWVFGRMYLTEDEKGHKKKPAYDTFKLMVKKLDNFIKVIRLDEQHNFYKFDFTDKEPVYVVWSDREGIADFSSFIPDLKIKVAKTLKEENRDDFISTVISPDKLYISDVPLFIEPENGDF
jgi:hypothetical protein